MLVCTEGVAQQARVLQPSVFALYASILQDPTTCFKRIYARNKYYTDTTKPMLHVWLQS